MEIKVRKAEFGEVAALRELYRQEANCQIVHDSILPRGMADPYLIRIGGRLAGYGGVWNTICPCRLMEFYALPHDRDHGAAMYRELLLASEATHAEAQTNIPTLLVPFEMFAKNVTEEATLFHDAATTQLTCPNGVFRKAKPEDAASMFVHQREPVGDWVIESQGKVVATGGFLCHYNPPYADVFMEVAEDARRQGFGSYLVQELKRVCCESGKKPAARCDRANVASRSTLERAGFAVCGAMLVGEVDLLPGE